MEIRGTYTALVTPFNPDKSIDFVSLNKLIEMQLAAKVEGILVLGTTGEGPTVGQNELDELFAYVKETIAGRSQCLFGTTSNCTNAVIRKTKIAEKYDPDAVLIATPYYNKPTQKGLYEHYKAICEETDVPIMVYNVPSRTAVNMEADTAIKIAEFKNIVATKEASGDLEQIKAIIDGAPEGFVVVSGNDDQNIDIIKLGGRGAVSVLSNPCPGAVKRIVDFALEGDFDSALKIQEQYKSFTKALFTENNPQAVKTLMSYLGYCEEEFRLPLTTMLEENKSKVTSAWEAVNQQ